jgi:tetratricopeptide (TPR) repeat protein
MQATMLLAGGRIDELAANLGRDLAAEGPRVGDAMLQLVRGFARYPDRVAVNRLFEALTKPYPQLAEATWRARRWPWASVKSTRRGCRRPGAGIAPGLGARGPGQGRTAAQGRRKLEFLKAWLATNSGAQQARLGYARALVGEKRYEDARAEFRSLLAANPDNPEILYAVGILSLQVNAVGDAEQPLRRYVELGRGDLNPARFYLGQIAEQAQRLR